MRFIHSADWHLGNRMHNVDRKEEFGNFLTWLKREIENQKAETLVIAGDIFDTANPPTEARTQYNQFLASLLRTCCRNVIIVGGNHDSGALLDSEKEILKALNIHVVGSLANLTPEEMVFELKNDSDQVTGICAAVPYAHEVELRHFYEKDVEKGQLSDLGYAELYKQVYAAADKLRNGRDIPVIATGHLYAANLEGRYGNEEDEGKWDDGKRQLDVVGNLGSVHVGSFPKEFDYVALGHIHYPTMVAKNPKIRYSGSPLILGFDEHNLKHCILSVDVEKDKEPEVQKIEVPETVIYKRISGKCAEIESKLKDLVKNNPGKEVNIEVDYLWEEGVDINASIEKWMEFLPENMAIVHKKKNEEQKVSGGEVETYDDIGAEELTFEEIFTSLIIKKSIIDKTDKTPEQIQEIQNEKVGKYLNLLLDSVNDYEKGVRYEDK